MDYEIEWARVSPYQTPKDDRTDEEIREELLQDDSYYSHRHD